MVEFDWDDEKNRLNRAKHGWDFRDAALAFLDPLVHGVEDRTLDYGERRYKLTGFDGTRLVTVVYTERAGIVRLISAYKPSAQERGDYEDKVR